MKIKVRQPYSRDTQTDVVAWLRSRAAECIEKHAGEPPRSECAFDEKPLNLWEAKLCLEIAQLFQATEK